MPQLLNDVELHFVNNIDAAWEMKRWLGERRPNQVLGFDTETHGLDIYAPHAQLRMVQIGDEKHGWAIPWERWGGVALEALDAWEGEWTAHNLSFDAKVMRVLAKYEIPWSRFHDTTIASGIANPGAPVALKVQTDRYVDPRASAGQKRLDKAFKSHGWTWATVPIDYQDYWFYSALDPVLAVHLYNHYAPSIQEFSKAYDLEMAVRRICTEIEHTGMRIDLDYVREKNDRLTEQIENAKKWAEDNWNTNIASPAQLVDLFKGLGAEFTVYTDGGEPSVKKEQLDIFAESEDPTVSAAANYVLEVRKYEKLNSSYFENFLNMHDDQVIHCSIKTMGARTGRMSVTDPALQTLPSNDSFVRGAFLNRRDGETLVACDYSQVEMRLLAHLSEDEALIDAFNTADKEGTDFFVEIGKLVYDDPEFTKADKRRKLIKGLMYGSAYGSGIPKMAKTAGVPIKDMEKTAEDLFTQFPGIKAFMAKVEAEGDERQKKEGVGYVTLEDGRRLPADKGKMYTLTNYSIQGLAAYLMKKSLVRLDLAGLTPYIQMVIHDEVLFSIPDEEVEYWMPIIEECMSYISGEYRVGLPAEPEILGTRWGDGDKYA